MKKLAIYLIILVILIILAVIGYKSYSKEAPVEPRNLCETTWWALTDCTNTWAIVYANCTVESWCIQVEAPVVEPTIATPTVWTLKVIQVAQPTKLAGNYSGNGAILRVWAKENPMTFDIPTWAKDVIITFKLAKTSIYNKVPGNIQAWADGKKLCNGRLMDAGVLDNSDNSTYVYKLTNVTTEDRFSKVSGFGTDRSYAIGKTLTIQAWIGENGNRIEYVFLDWNL